MTDIQPPVDPTELEAEAVKLARTKPIFVEEVAAEAHKLATEAKDEISKLRAAYLRMWPNEDWEIR